MTKPFLIVDISGGILGKIYQRDTYDEAVDCATDLVLSQFEIQKDTQKAADIRKGIDENIGYHNPDGIFELDIAQVEDE